MRLLFTLLIVLSLLAGAFNIAELRDEQALAAQRLQIFGLRSSGNLILTDDRPPHSPVLFFLGYNGTGLYGFLQKRFENQAVDQYWAGIRTTVPANPVADGYGGLPLDLWGQNFRAAPDGTLISRTSVTSILYLSEPVYRNLTSGQFESPSSWSPSGEPLAADGSLLGGIMYNQSALHTFLTLHNGVPVLVHNGIIYPLTPPE